MHGRHIQKKLPTPYSETDIYRLLAWLRVYKPWALDIARIYLETCMRRGELMQLRWVDVDLPQRLFVLPQAKNRHARVIPFTNRAERIMRRLYACRAEGAPNGEVLGSSADIRKILYEAGKDRGVDTFRPIHRLRDTFGTRAAERMALEDQLKNARARGSGAGRGESDVSVMHDFIRKQAINQQADYSVRAYSLSNCVSYPENCIKALHVISSSFFRALLLTYKPTHPHTRTNDPHGILHSGRGKVKRQKDMDPPSS